MVFISPKPLFLYLSMVLAFLIVLISLIAYIGTLRGLICALAIIILPILLEYIFTAYKLPFTSTSLITNLTKNGINFNVDFQTLFMIFTLPTYFISAIFYAQKIRLFTDIKKYNKTFITITASLLITLNFLTITTEKFEYQNAVKWLAIALIVNIILSKLYKFKTTTHDIYKELPIIIFLMIYGYNILQVKNLYYLAITICLVLFYLILLYNEHQYKKISARI